MLFDCDPAAVNVLSVFICAVVAVKDACEAAAILAGRAYRNPIHIKVGDKDKMLSKRLTM